MSILDRLDRIRLKADDPSALAELDALELDLTLLLADLRVARSEAAAGDEALREAMGQLADAQAVFEEHRIDEPLTPRSDFRI